MIELSNERIEQILHEETPKTEELRTILRSIYTRYMRLYERYLADIDALDDNRIAELREYREETLSLVKHYYMDIPQDIAIDIAEFENKYGSKLLGPRWHDYLYDVYREFSEKSVNREKSEEAVKEEFKKQTLAAFYSAMGHIFRDGFDSGSQTARNLMSGITGLLFGK